METRIADPWWRVVEEIARMIESNGFKQSELAESHVKKDLLAAGHTESDVNTAINCVEKAFLSGNFYDCLTMTQQLGSDFRILHPAESPLLPYKIWQGLLVCRKKGVISSEVFERIVEGIRLFDLRGLTTPEVDDVFHDLLSNHLPQHVIDTVFAVVNGNKSESCH
ncbi:MAG: DUF494 family protein [Oligoflexales bacterium]